METDTVIYKVDLAPIMMLVAGVQHCIDFGNIGMVMVKMKIGIFPAEKKEVFTGYFRF